MTNTPNLVCVVTFVNTIQYSIGKLKTSQIYIFSNGNTLMHYAINWNNTCLLTPQRNTLQWSFLWLVLLPVKNTFLGFVQIVWIQKIILQFSLCFGVKVWKKVFSFVRNIVLKMAAEIFYFKNSELKCFVRK